MTLQRPEPTTSRSTRLAVTLSLLLAGPAGAQQPSPGTPAHYAIARRFPVGGEGSWDYPSVDTVGHRLFLTRADRMTVVDEASGRVLGGIPGPQRGHGVAFAHPSGHGFVTSGADSTVTMFDLIDAATGRRVRSISLGGTPEFGVRDGRGRLHVKLEDGAQVVEPEARAMRVTRRWALGPCESPSGVAIDRAHGLLFSGCRNKVMAVSDAAGGRFVTSVPIGGGVDGNAFDARTNTAFSSNGDGTLTVLHEDSPAKFTVVQTVETMPGARTIALDPVSHAVSTASAQLGEAPAATAADPRPRRPVLPGTFTVLRLERER